jgi:tetratricopeptide (TPR) repeat protein
MFTSAWRGLFALIVMLMLAPAPVWAAGGSSTTSDTEATTAATGDPWTAKWGDLGTAYADATKLAEEGKYEEALTALAALNKPEDPRVLNWQGYATRKLGKPQDALAFYDKALTIAPEYTPAREYRGEAYVELKQLDKAKAELAEIEKLCGNTTCSEYVDLAAAIKKAEGGGGWFDWLFN